MADITVTYKGSTIGEISASGNHSINTAGKYCEDDIGIAYTKPGGGGDTVYYTSAGVCYIEQMSTPSLPLSLNVNSIYNGATEMKSFSTQYSGQLGGSGTYRINEWFKYCTKLEIAHFPNVSAIKNTYTDRPFLGCSMLKDFTVGSVGVSVTEFKTSTAASFKFFYDLTQADLVITVFVAANSIAEISTDITSQAPWGATNATIVYRNSTTGEVITA